jgi:hypothetical protein
MSVEDYESKELRNKFFVARVEKSNLIDQFINHPPKFHSLKESKKYLEELGGAVRKERDQYNDSKNELARLKQFVLNEEIRSKSLKDETDGKNKYFEWFSKIVQNGCN